MRRIVFSLLVVPLALAAARGAETAALRLVATIPLPNVEGRIDHFGIDLKGERLFMSALGNNTIEVFDLRANKRLHTITGLHEPQGVTYAPDSGKIFVANGGDGTLRVFDGATYKLLSEVHFTSDADDTRYNAATQRIFVGYGEGGIGALDSTTGRLLGKVEFEGHPEAFEVDQTGKRIFVNNPTARQILVIDWERQAVADRWPMETYRSNFPMASDEAEHRLFVVSRRPAQFLVFDNGSGKLIAHLPVVGDADDVWYDAARKRIYVSGGEGFISVITQRDSDHYVSIGNVPTAPGARTSFLSPELGRLYVAVPRRGTKNAELRVYAVGP